MLIRTRSRVSLVIAGVGVLGGCHTARPPVSVAPVRQMALGGPWHRGAHSPEESVNLNSLTMAAERAAVLIRRLITATR